MELILKIDDADFAILDAYYSQEGGIEKRLNDFCTVGAASALEVEGGRIYAAGLAEFKAKPVEEQRAEIMTFKATVALCEVVAQVAKMEEK